MLQRLENFLDEVEKVSDPGRLEEPYRSLWLRVHGEQPTLRPKGAISTTVSPMIAEPELKLSDLEVAPSDGIDMKSIMGEGKKRIEVLSPKEVGPTFEMKVEEEGKKLTFKAADEVQIRASTSKKEAGELMVRLQTRLAPMKGLGGEFAKAAEEIREVAVAYRSADYEKAASIARSIWEMTLSEEMQKKVILLVQRRITDYQEIGADLSKAKESFKLLAHSLKEGRDDFYDNAAKTLALAEESIKGLVTEEVVAEVVVAEVKEEPKALELKRPEVKEPPKPEPLVPAPGPMPEKTAEKAPEQAKEDIKPVVKIVKKKLSPVIEPLRTSPSEEVPELEEVVETHQVKKKAKVSIEEESPKAESKPEPSMAPKEDPKPEPAPKKEAPKEASPDKAQVEEAFKKIQLVYKAAVAMHAKGKDVKQLFDLINVAEEASKKGNMKMYIGLAKQLESMLLQMQK